MLLPKNFIDNYKSKIEGTLIFNIPIEKLSKEELMVSLVCMREAYTESLKSNKRDINFLSKIIENFRIIGYDD